MRLFLLLATIATVTTTANAQEPRKFKTKDLKPEYSLTLKELEDEYTNNAVAADKKYKRKAIEVTGEVYSVRKITMSTSVQVDFKVKGGMFIKAHFMEDKKSLVDDIKKGDTITVIGHCAGITDIGDVWISRCCSLKKKE